MSSNINMYLVWKYVIENVKQCTASAISTPEKYWSWCHRGSFRFFFTFSALLLFFFFHLEINRQPLNQPADESIYKRADNIAKNTQKPNKIYIKKSTTITCIKEKQTYKQTWNEKGRKEKKILKRIKDNTKPTWLKAH